MKEFRFSYYDYVDELRLAWKSPYLNMMQSNSSLSHYNTESARDHIYNQLKVLAKCAILLVQESFATKSVEIMYRLLHCNTPIPHFIMPSIEFCCFKKQKGFVASLLLVNNIEVILKLINVRKNESESQPLSKHKLVGWFT